MVALNSQAFKDLAPSQIVPRLTDQKIHVASESTMYRLLRQEAQLAHRRSERVASRSAADFLIPAIALFIVLSRYDSFIHSGSC